MDNKKLEYIILYTLVACIAISVAGVVRLFSVSLGLDEFTANILFVVTIAIIAIVYLSIHVFLQSAVIPLISNLLMNIPYFKNRQNSVEEEITTQPKEENMPTDLETIRIKHLQEEQKRKDQLLDTALQYTRKTFVPHASDENIDIICLAVTDYFNGVEISISKPVSTKDLSNGDLFHYGWNIWNHFKSVRRNKQEDIAHFLKSVFARPLKDVEIETVRKKLTFNEGKFKIELEKLILFKKNNGYENAKTWRLY